MMVPKDILKTSPCNDNALSQIEQSLQDAVRSMKEALAERETIMARLDETLAKTERNFCAYHTSLSRLDLEVKRSRRLSLRLYQTMDTV